MWDEWLTVGQRIKKCWKKHTAGSFYENRACLDTHHCLSDSHITHRWDQHLRVFSTPEGMYVLRGSSIAFHPAINSEVTSQHPSWLSSRIWGPWGAFPGALGTRVPEPGTLQAWAWQPCTAALGCAGAFQSAPVLTGNELPLACQVNECPWHGWAIPGSLPVLQWCGWNQSVLKERKYGQ